MNRHKKKSNTKQTSLDRPQNTLICSDSKSCLISLKNTFTQDPLILDIQDKTYTATRKGMDIAFVWVPGHRGIAGNEEANKGAKRAAKQVPIVEPLSLANVNQYLKDTVWRRLGHEYDTAHDKPTTHQDGESRPQQTKTWTYATDAQSFTDEPTAATVPLLWGYSP